ncbi:MAG: DUF971 domain-containing protein [Gammaproteobacteria bacterium]|nr:DUF971 domain-containing protein [Gammaproteobacteria bacterium]
MPDTPHPVEIILHRAARTLEIAFDDGARFTLPCEYLRIHSPSAEVQGHHGAGAVLQVGKAEVNIEELRPIGHYALKIVFDDGHRSGLFTWAYLYQLGREQARLWQNYLDRLAVAGQSRHPA